jgi:hypothetical protein
MKIKFYYERDWDVVESGGWGIPYKPDFFLIDFGIYAEVKPQFEKIDIMDLRKIKGWAKDAEDVLVLSGPPRLLNSTSTAHHLFSLNEHSDRVFVHYSQWWCECPRCHRIGIVEFGGVPAECRQTCLLFGEDGPEPDGHKSKRLKAAYRYAQNFKF